MWRDFVGQVESSIFAAPALGVRAEPRPGTPVIGYTAT